MHQAAQRASSQLACSTSYRCPPVSHRPTGGGGRCLPRRGRRAAPARVANPDTQLADDHQLDTSDAFAELVRMAVEKDPSLAPLAEQHLKKKAAAPVSPFASPAAPASSMLGPSLGTLPNSSKPPWLRQRAPQVGPPVHSAWCLPGCAAGCSRVAPNTPMGPRIGVHAMHTWEGGGGGKHPNTPPCVLAPHPPG